ncbi:glutamate racemase [Clostridium sp. CAG:557]|nr:glutamate racemase [Clostridium sp. CAG:557]
MNNKPIGVFDSGLGGLTAVKELLKVLPYENIIYFGDTGRVPYGDKSRKTILKYALQDIEFLKSLDVKMILAACGTVSSILEESNVNIEIPFTGVITPTATAAASATRNNKIGIIGTTATIKSGSYKRELLKINPSLQIFEQDCPLFVPLVENGFIEKDNKATLIIAEKYLAGLRNKKIDTLILGCTHYPIISEIISKVIGPEVKLIDSGREAAIFAANALSFSENLTERKNSGSCVFFVSDTVNSFSKNAGLFLQQNVSQKVKMVDIEKYSVPAERLI